MPPPPAACLPYALVFDPKAKERRPPPEETPPVKQLLRDVEKYETLETTTTLEEVRKTDAINIVVDAMDPIPPKVDPAPKKIGLKCQ